MEKELIVKINIEDKAVNYFTSFTLQQTFNAHHYFELRFNHAEMGSPGLINLDNSRDFVGKTLVASFGYPPDKMQDFAGSAPSTQTHAIAFIDPEFYRGLESVWEEFELPILKDKKGMTTEVIDINDTTKMNIMSLEKEHTNDFIKLIGRSGLRYYDEHGQGYYIESEIMAGAKYDYALYLSKIFLIDEVTHPPREIQNQIIERVQYLCELKGMKPHWFSNNE